MKYKSSYKYQLVEDYEVDTGLFGEGDEIEFVQLFSYGKLNIESGYAWDGASGPTIDTKSTMRASLVHDALYQLMRQGVVDRSYRKKVDDLFYKILREDGMGRFRAWYYYKAVRTFGKGRELESYRRKVQVAP